MGKVWWFGWRYRLVVDAATDGKIMILALTATFGANCPSGPPQSRVIDIGLSGAKSSGVFYFEDFEARQLPRYKIPSFMFK
jgi:hypothetical protein